MSKRRVKNTVNPNKIPYSEIDLQNRVIVDISYYSHWLDCVEFHQGRKDFTNILHDSAEAAHKLYEVIDTIGHLEKTPFTQINNNRHFHQVTDKELDLCLGIIDKITDGTLLVEKLDPNGDKFEQLEDLNFFQVPSETGSIRIIGVIVTGQYRTFYPLFVDYYHLIYPDQNYNQPDFKSNSFKLQDEFGPMKY